MSKEVDSPCTSKFSRLAFALTPKELCHIAQGCERSELPWEPDSTVLCTPTGFRPRSFSKAATPFGVGRDRIRSPRVARWRGQPWAMRRNSFGVKTARATSHLERLSLRASRFCLLLAVLSGCGQKDAGILYCQYSQSEHPQGLCAGGGRICCLVRRAWA